MARNCWPSDSFGSVVVVGPVAMWLEDGAASVLAGCRDAACTSRMVATSPPTSTRPITTHTARWLGASVPAVRRSEGPAPKPGLGAYGPAVAPNPTSGGGGGGGGGGA